MSPPRFLKDIFVVGSDFFVKVPAIYVGLTGSLNTLGCNCSQLGTMALGFVRSTVELLTCGHGITPVRGFHQLTCPLLYRLALVLVLGICVWKWTISVATLDHNQSCSIGFDGSAGGIAQSLACTMKLGKCRRSEGLRSFNPSKGTNDHSHHFGWGY